MSEISKFDLFGESLNKSSNETILVHINRDEFDVYIGRPSKWGNPYTHVNDRRTNAEYVVDTRTDAVDLYEKYITEGDGVHLLDDLHELCGKKLGCWCHPKKCHGEVLIKLINEKYGSQQTEG